MSKSANNIAVLVLALLLFSSLTHAARLEPADAKAAQELPEILRAEQSGVVVKGCGTECMMRRTLDAHLDYIYTQKKHN